MHDRRETASRLPRRLSLPLSAQDIKDLELIRGFEQRRSALPERVSEHTSEAELVHAVFEARLARVREAIELAGYRELYAGPDLRGNPSRDDR